MSDRPHYVIIGTGPAGDEAASCLRQRDGTGRITMITATKLLYIRRFDLYKVITGVDDWRQLLVHPPQYYDDLEINVRRNTHVAHVEPRRQVLALHHKEEIHYDKLLVASGGGGYVPEDLREYRHLIQRFGSFEDAIRMRQVLPEGGRILIFGGDLMGIDLARHLVTADYTVTLIGGEQLFWPHQVSDVDRPRFVAALESSGVEVILDRKVTRIEQGARGLSARRVILDDDSELRGDVVMAFCGLMPALEFMIGSGLDIQRGLLVDPHLATSNEHIWAAGDVCQIWSPEEKSYRFSYEWKNVRSMGRVAAQNMTGAQEAISTFHEGGLQIDDQGRLATPFWDYDQ